MSFAANIRLCVCKKFSDDDHGSSTSIRRSCTTTAAANSPIVSTSTTTATTSSIELTKTLTRSFLETPKVIERKEKEKKENEAELYAFWDYQSLFASQRNEVIEPLRLEVVEGAVPEDLNGAYYLCGAGIRSDDAGSSVSPLDGHGYLRKFAIAKASVTYSARYVKTEALEEEYDEETNAWNFTYRGPFSILRSGPRIGNFKVMKNVANTSVMQWGGKLMCLWEGGLPYEMDANSLDTIGCFRLPFKDVDVDVAKNEDEGVFTALKNFGLNFGAQALLLVLTKGFDMPKERVLAHFKVDEKRQRLVVITSNAEDMLLPKATFTAYEFDASMKLIQRRQFLLHDHLMVHDWALTDKHYLILGNRIRLDTASSLAALAGLSPMISCLNVDNSTQCSPLYILPRSSDHGSHDWRVPAMVPGQLWMTHAANAYEEPVEASGDRQATRFVLDGCMSSYNWFSLWNMFGYNWREGVLDPGAMNQVLSINPETVVAPRMRRVSVEVESEVGAVPVVVGVEGFKNADFTCDLPAINPTMAGSKNKYIYVASNSGRCGSMPNFPFDCISKLDAEPLGCVRKWYAEDRCFVGEPHFVPRLASSKGEEDDGYLVFVQYSIANGVCYLVILDAQRIGNVDAVVARVKVPEQFRFPFGFHGVWHGI